MKSFFAAHKIDPLLLAFFVAISSVLASVVLSQTAGLPPCTYCWYQRIAMFPLPLILGAAYLAAEKNPKIYVLPLAFVGMLLAGYHSLLQWGIITEEASTCSLTGPSCAEPDILWLGFLTIPFGAFLSFTAVTYLTWIASNNKKSKSFEPSRQQNLVKVMFFVVIVAAIAVILVDNSVDISGNF